MELTALVMAEMAFSGTRRVTANSMDPLVNVVPAVTPDPRVLATGIDSPVRDDSSAVASPFKTTPSVGMISPEST